MGKTLIAYFSHSGENYADGEIVELPVGNTAIIADKIHIMTSFDVFEIETVRPYPFLYRETTEIAKQEQERGERPLLKNFVDNIEEYDRILLGYPNWWGTVPMAVCTFLEQGNIDGKEIFPFCTHESGGAGKSRRDIKRICVSSEVHTPLEIEGHSVRSSDHIIIEWIKFHKLA